MTHTEVNKPKPKPAAAHTQRGVVFTSQRSVASEQLKEERSAASANYPTSLAVPRIRLCLYVFRQKMLAAVCFATR